MSGSSQPPAAGSLVGATVKEAVHELGHAVELGHCPNPRCIMHFSDPLADMNHKGQVFCTRHRKTG